MRDEQAEIPGAIAAVPQREPRLDEFDLAYAERTVTVTEQAFGIQVDLDRSRGEKGLALVVVDLRVTDRQPLRGVADLPRNHVIASCRDETSHDEAEHGRAGAGNDEAKSDEHRYGGDDGSGEEEGPDGPRHGG